MVTYPDVSVVIPFHGRLPLVRQAVDSVLAQRGVICQLIVVDDGSDENTALLEHYVEDHGGTFIRQAHAGISAARNAGLAGASGRWITFVDSDDLIYPDKVATQVHAMCAVPGAVWSCTGFDLLSPSGQCIGGDSLPGVDPAFWRISCPFGSTSVLALREVVNRAGGFDVAFDRSEDWDFFIRLGKISPPVIIRERMYGYRVHCGNVSGRDPERWRNAWELLARKHDLAVAPGSYAGLQYNRPRISPNLFHTSELAAEFA